VFICFLVALIVFSLGTIFGLVAGYYRGKPDTIISQGVRLFESFPRIITVWVILLILSDCMGTHTTQTKLWDALITGGVLGLLCVPILIRSIKERLNNYLGENYIIINRVHGISNRRVLWILFSRNSLDSIIISISYIIGFALILDTNIGFLYNQLHSGGGINHMTLGMKVSSEWTYGSKELWSLITTILMILGFYFLGEGIIDYRQKRKTR
jgi:peptide/nickel transport system permease protein